MKIKDKILIAECTAYDFKEMLEKKKLKSWLKSIYAFSNTDGGSLYYGVSNDGKIVGLKDTQSDADFISETIKSRIDPILEFEILPLSHCYRTIGGFFYTTFYNQNWKADGRISMEKIVERINGCTESVGVNEENVGVNEYPIGRTAQKILDIVIADPSITQDKIAEKISITKRSVERQVKNLRDRGILIHEGSDKTGYWRVLPSNKK